MVMKISLDVPEIDGFILAENAGCVNRIFTLLSILRFILSFFCYDLPAPWNVSSAGVILTK